MDNKKKEKQILISVIVPVYNVEKYIERCVNSILNQSVDELEVILIDDGSEDKSGILCDEFQTRDNRIRVIHKENAGVSEARNSGLNVAKGRYVVFVDSDDFVMPEYLENLNIDPYDLVISGKKIQEVDGRIIENCYENKIYETMDPTSFEELFGRYFLNSCYAKRFRRDIIEENNIRFSTELKIIEDTVFVLEYAQYCKKIKVIDKTDYCYVRYGENTSLSSQTIDIDLIMMEEKANELIYQKLVNIVGKRSVDIMIARMAGYYEGIFCYLLNCKKGISYQFIRRIFQQKWFRSTLDCANEVYAMEGEKFCNILKLKSPFIFWIFLCVMRKRR